MGSTISDHRIVEKLGEWVMGLVYKAKVTTLEHTLAFIFLAAHLLDGEEAKSASVL